MTENAQPSVSEFDPFGFLSYRGRIGRGLYFLGLVFEFLLWFLGLAAFASAMSSTGGSSGGPALLFLVAPLVMWIHSLLAAKRLRDAGKPTGAMIFLALAPYIWIPILVLSVFLDNAEGLERAVGAIWPLLLVLFAGLLLLPGLLPRKASPAAA